MNAEITFPFVVLICGLVLIGLSLAVMFLISILDKLKEVDE